MPVNPMFVLTDLEKYIDIYGIRLSKEARKTFQEVEEFSFKCNYPSGYPLFFSKIIRNFKGFQKCFYSKKLNPTLAALQLELAYYSFITTKTDYVKGTILYSYIHNRGEHINTDILDRTLEYCVKDDRSIIENKDILQAAMDSFQLRLEDNKKVYEDERLDADLCTLCHLVDRYEPNLFIDFNFIRNAIIKEKSLDRGLFLLKGELS